MKPYLMSKEVEKSLDEIIEVAVKAVKDAQRKSGRLPDKSAMLRGITSVITQSHMDISNVLMNETSLPSSKVSQLINKQSIAYLYVSALFSAALDANTQWDSDELFVEQYLHHLRRLKSFAVVVDVREKQNRTDAPTGGTHGSA